jgi:hypothetical protein
MGLASINGIHTSAGVLDFIGGVMLFSTSFRGGGR